MSFKELDKCLNEYLRSLKALNKAEKRAQVLNARKQRNEQLTRAAKQMRARGASEGSIQRTVKAFNDYFDLIKIKNLLILLDLHYT